MAEYNKITAEVLEQLKAAAPGHILTGEDVNADYGRARACRKRSCRRLPQRRSLRS